MLVPAMFDIKESTVMNKCYIARTYHLKQVIKSNNEVRIYVIVPAQWSLVIIIVQNMHYETTIPSIRNKNSVSTIFVKDNILFKLLKTFEKLV